MTREELKRDQFTELIATAITSDHTLAQRLAGVEILGVYDRLTAANKQLMEVIKRLQPISTISFEDWEAVKKAPGRGAGMTIIDLNNHNQLPDTPLIGYILLSPEEAAREHARRWGVVKAVYRVTRGKKVTLYIEKVKRDD